MLSPRKFAAGKKFLQRWQKAKKRQAKRGIQLESLEKRELMAADFSPGVESALATMRIADPAIRVQIGNMLTARYGGGSSTSSGTGGLSGESGAPFSTSEAEPNSVRSQANFLPFGIGPGKSSVVNVNGQMNNIWDEDYFAFDLKKGDIIDIRANAIGIVQPGLTLFNSAGRELLHSKQPFYPPAVGRPIPDKSPRFTTGGSTLTYVIDTDGRYFLSINDASLSYSINMRAYRPTIEQEPIGTKQKLFVDFDGAFLRSDVVGLNPTAAPSTVRIPGLAQALPQLGLTDADEPALIRNIMSRVEQKLRLQLAQDSLNGWYAQTGNPGDFDIEILNSLEHPDVWGQPNVARMIVGGNAPQFGFPAGLYGIAEWVDIGNFNREDTAVTFLDAAIFEAQTTPRAGNVPLADSFAQSIADTIVHEMGHLLGVAHTSFTNNVITIMDGFLIDQIGQDGLFGTPDDQLLTFKNDEYELGETTAGGGVNNTAQVVAWAAATGKVGSTISGLVYNDINRNARQDAGEAGIGGWEVYVDLNNNGTRELGEPRATTAANGGYSLFVAPGAYNVRVTRPAGWVASTNAEVVKSVTVTTAGATANFGSSLPSNLATGYKWLDINGDGIKDSNEPGLAGVYIYLDLDGDDRPDVGEPAAITKTDGSYSLTPPSAGVFTIREVVDAGYRQTFPASGEHIVNFDGITPLRGFDFGNTESADWGDAPSPYPTTRAQNGAYHGQLSGLRLGVNWDAEQDGQPSTTATGDDANGILDDEDGVSLLAPIVRGDNSNILQFNVTNTTGSPAYLQGWVDFNGDGDWSDAGEQIVTNLLVSASGLQNVTFSAPANAVNRTYARFRLSQTQNIGPAGRAGTGEVEDYVFDIVNGPRTLLQPDSATVARNSQSNVIDVIANDFALPGESWRVTGVSSGSRGGRVTIDTVNNRVLYTPALSFIGVDEFTYTAVTATGRSETARVTVNVVAQFLDPVAVDDSFDVPTNSIGFPLNVLANDVEGAGGALVVTNVTSPDKGGSVTIGSGGQSIRYTPRRDFGGTETFSYTATDATGKSTTAKITVHTIAGDRADDLVEFSFGFYNLAGEPITEIRQGEQFITRVFVDDLRPERGAAQVPPQFVTDPGVYAAYLDILYSSGLVAPASPTSNNGLDFETAFFPPYQSGRDGSAAIPGIIDEFGAFAGSVPSMNFPNRVPLANIVFTATNPGLAEFVGDPADRSPQSDVVFYNTTRSGVPIEEIRYGRSTLEVVPSGVNFPYAKDDSPARLPAGQSSTIDVLANDIQGTQPPIRISSTTQPAGGQVQISDNGTPTIFSDDRIIYTPNTNFTGTDSFKYTITDQRGFTSTATVTVQVGTEAQVQADDLVQLRLSITDLAGQEITQVTAGSKFQLRGFVQDLRNNPVAAGVFAAYQDILYSSNLVSVDTQANAPFFQINYGPDYVNATSGDVRIAGLINEVGSAQTSGVPLGTSERLQFVITMTANAAGVASFVGDPADIKPFNDTLLFNPTTPLATNQIRYLSDSLVIVGSGGTGGTGGGGGEGFTNLRNAFDVNDDGFVSPIDVLILVNSLNAGGGGALSNNTNPGASGESTERYYFDVNADTYLSPLDVLAVINVLNSRSASGGEGEGSGSVPLVEANAPTNDFVEVPFQSNKLLDVAVATLYGPMMEEGEEDEEELLSLAAYLENQDSDEEDLFDGLASALNG